MIPTNLSSHQWAIWLEKIEQNPGKHKVIARENDSFTFLDPSKLDSTSQKVLTSREILDISHTMLDCTDLSLLDRCKILNGMKYLNDRRQAKYDELHWLIRLLADIQKAFAEAMGWGFSMATERETIQTLELAFESEIDVSQHMQLKLIQERVQDLQTKQQKGAFDHSLKRENLNEAIFACAKELHELQMTTTDAEDLKAIEQLNHELEKLNPHLPNLFILVQSLGTSFIKDTLEDTLEALCQSYEVEYEEEELEFDCRTFKCNPTEMRSMYVQRRIIAQNTGWKLSTIANIEEVWQRVLEEPKPRAQEIKVDDFYVIFIPSSKKGEGEILVKEKFLKAGSYKAAFLTSSYFAMNEAKNRYGLVVLQPKRILDDLHPTTSQSEADQVKDKTKLTPPGQMLPAASDGFVARKVAKDKKAQEEKIAKEREDYLKEAQFCLELGDLPGMWPTYKTLEIDGDIAIVQQAAGYQITPLGSTKEQTVIELAHIHKLLNNKKLTTEQEVVFLNMVGDFLNGVQSLEKHKIIHRDLKPQNILCGHDGRAGIADLGVACRSRVADENDKSLPNPDKEFFIGTAFYCCPEMIAADIGMPGASWRDMTTKADVWSAGIVLWELLSGKHVSSHPALANRTIQHAAVIQIAEIAEDSTAYEERFQEPENKDSLLHLIWSCTRADPTERPGAGEVKERYQQWARNVQQQLEDGEISSILDAFANELEAEALQTSPTEEEASLT